MVTDWNSKLNELKLTSLTYEHLLNRLSVSYRDSIQVDGEEVPYEHLPLLFEKLSYTRREWVSGRDQDKKSFYLRIGSKEFGYTVCANGDTEYNVNGKLHCALGPAAQKNGERFYYKHGQLHNDAGPAIDDGTNKSYFLDGKLLSLIEFVENSPKSRHTWGTRGTGTFTSSQLGEHAVVRGMDGTVALLAASNEPPNIDDLILDLVGARIPGYRVALYENIGYSIAPLYSYLQHDSSPWKTVCHPEYTRASYSAKDGTRAVLFYSKTRNTLSYRFKGKNGSVYSSLTDFAFDPFSTRPSTASYSFPAIEVHRSEDGSLHNPRGPAINLPHISNRSDAQQLYYLNGVEVSKEEHSRYDSVTQSIVFKNSDGNYHRVDGPAIIDFLPQGEVTKYWFENGQMIPGSPQTEKPKLINLAGTEMPTYTDLNVKQEQRQNKFEEALKRVARRQNEAKDRDNLGGEMETKTTKHGEAAAATSDSRVRQVTAGAKLGLQKAALRVGSQKVAEKIVEVASPADNVVVQRIVQLALLLGTAELAERLPDGAASKVGFTEQRREGYGGLARYVAGETLGRDAVDIVSFVAPMLLDKLQGISAEEISELTSDAEEFERLESQVAASSK
jgi:hypothetical protein